MSLLWKILGFARPLGWLLPQYIILIMAATLFSVLNLATIIPLLQVLFDQVNQQQVSAVTHSASTLATAKSYIYSQIIDLIRNEGQTAGLYFICVALVSFVIAANIFRYLSQLILARVRVRIIYNLRLLTYKSLLEMPLQRHKNYRNGDLISRITADVQEMEQSAVNALKVFVKEPFLIIGYLAALLAISPPLTLYTLLLVPVAGFAVSIIASKVKKWARQSQKTLGSIGNIVDETLFGIKILRIFNGKGNILDRFDTTVDKYASDTYKMASRSNLSAPISEIIGTLVVSLLLIRGGQLVLGSSHELSASAFIGFLIIFSQLLHPAKAISVATSQISKGLAAAERVFEIINEPKDKPASTHLIPVPTKWNSISIDNLSFSYENKKILHNINLKLVKGQQVALVGPSGAGKTTLADLICGFIKPNNGFIRIGDHDILQFDPQDWQKQIAIVTQEPILFHDSVYNNIALGHPHATPQEVFDAAKKADVHDFILSLEKGYDTIIIEHGNNLSGGQKQKISIARAFLKDAPILILDEATSALDAQSADNIHSILQSLMVGRATLIIAHRLSTIKNADNIIVMQNGEIVQQGTHSTLESQHGMYNEFIRMQTI